MANATLICSKCGATNEPLSTYCFACQHGFLSVKKDSRHRKVVIVKSAHLRILGLLGIVSGVLQIVGVFLPFTITKDGFNRITLNADSLWLSVIHTVTEVHTPTGLSGRDFVQTDATYYTSICFICLFLLAILVPLLVALTELFNKWWQPLLILSLVCALLGFLELSLSALLEFALSGFCGPEAMSAADCMLVYGGPGLGFACCGFVLSIVCTIASNVLYSTSTVKYEKRLIVPHG